MTQTFKIITEAGDTEITFRFIEMECVGDSWVISAAYESEKPVDDTLSEHENLLALLERALPYVYDMVGIASDARYLHAEMKSALEDLG